MMDWTTNHTTVAALPFCFPILKNGEILQVMSELGIDLSKAELMEPDKHKTKLRKILGLLLEVCSGLSEEDFVASPSTLAHAATLPQGGEHLHAEFSELLFFQALRDCLTTCGYPHFSWRDLHAPTPKRLRHQLSAVINLAKFREEQLKVYAELNEPRSQLLVALEEVNVENAQLSEQLERTAAVSQASLEEIDAVAAECQALEVEIGRNNKLQAAAREEAAALKRQAAQLQDDLQTAQWELSEAEAQEERLRHQIVSSPDRRQAQVLLQRQRLEKEKAAVETMQQRLQDAKTKVLHANLQSKELQSVCILLDELADAGAQYQQLVTQQEDAQAQRQAHDKKTATVLADKEESQRALQRAEEKMRHQQKQHALQMQALQEALDMVKSQLLSVEKDRRQGMARVDLGEQEVRQLEAAIETETKKTAQEMQDMLADYRAVETEYLQRLEQRMQAIGAM